MEAEELEKLKKKLEELVDNLKTRGHNIKYISTRIGYDEKGQKIADAKRGKSQARLKQAIDRIQSHFADELGVDAPEIIDLKMINDKLNKILQILEK